MHNSVHVHIVYLLPGSCPVIVKPSISEIQSSSSGQFSIGLLNQGKVKTETVKIVEYIGQQKDVGEGVYLSNWQAFVSHAL